MIVKSKASLSTEDVIQRIKKIAYNMEDEKELLKVVSDKKQDIFFKGIYFKNWDPIPLSHGIPALCMLYGELQQHFQEDRFGEIGYKYLTSLMNSIEKKGITTASLYSGAAGIGLALDVMSKEPDDFKNIKKSVDKYIIKSVESFFKNYDEDLFMSDYDVIEGLSGIASYLFVRIDREEVKALLLQIIRFLIKITQYKEVEGVFVPGWYIKSENHFTEDEKLEYRKGSFNTGLAHGIVGPLIILCKALKLGIEVEGQKNAIRTIVKFLRETCSVENYTWSSMVSFENFINEKNCPPIFLRDAWCYGTPGICLGILNAGIALNENELIDFSIRAMERVNKKINGLYSPTMCHGYAGILQIQQSFQNILKKDIFADEMEQTFNKTLGYYKTDYLYGFYDYENRGKNEYEELASVGLLNGNVGVLLSLLSYKLGSKTNWRNAFLL